MANYPIWRDYDVTIPYNSSAAFTDYYVTKDGVTVYRGRAYNRPNASGVFNQAAKVRLNDIAADYLKQAFIPDLSQQTDDWAPGFAALFALVAGGTTRASDTLVLDWSYDYGRDVDRDSMHDPVDWRLDGRQRFIQTVFGQVASVSFAFNVGGTTVVALGAANSNAFVDISQIGSGSSLPTQVTTPAGTYTIDQSRCKGRYVLHYVNAYGGWDCLLMDGEPVRTESYDRKRMKTDYDNSSADRSAARGTSDYANEITPSWLLRTGLLTEAQAERMHHLTGSTLVYLEDLSDSMVYPVVLDDSAAEWRTGTGRAGKFAQYEIRATLAQERMRR